MTRRRHRLRRLLWAGLLLGLVVIVAVLSLADAGLRIYDQLVAVTDVLRRHDLAFPRRPALS
jgi:hypothetical protein